MRHILFLFANRAHGQGAGKFSFPLCSPPSLRCADGQALPGGEVPTGVSPLYPGQTSSFHVKNVRQRGRKEFFLQHLPTVLFRAWPGSRPWVSFRLSYHPDCHKKILRQNFPVELSKPPIVWRRSMSRHEPGTTGRGLALGLSCGPDSLHKRSSDR